MHLEFLIKVFQENLEKDSIIWKDSVFKYKWLLERVKFWQEKIEFEKIKKGSIIILESDFSPNSVALFLALISFSCVIVPLTSNVEAAKAEFMETAQGEILFKVDSNDNLEIKQLSNKSIHEFYNKLRELNHPGLVLFSSGSTGKSKAVVHDLLGILEKFKVKRHSRRTIAFLLFDHIGGINTMLYTLSNAGCIVTVQDRNPDNVLKAIELYKVEMLPTSPTFINLIILSESYLRYNLESLKTVTYGTEPMPESTLIKFHEILPNTNLLQTYGLSEVGILRSKSKGSDSLWVKIGGEGFETRIVNGILQVKAKSAMLGYLNAPSPFTEDGWFNTGDEVEVDGEFIKILGRKSELIFVGGEKVFPQEIENVIILMENVAQVIVFGEPNNILGNIVCAKIKLRNNEDIKIFKRKLKDHCRKYLDEFKIPMKVIISQNELFNERYKLDRNVKQ